MASEFTISRLSGDPDVSHPIWQQYCALSNAINLDKEQTAKLVECILETIRKLEAVNYHRKNLARIVSEEVADRNARAEPSAVQVFDRSTGAEKEFEALVLQAKATLDVMAKVLRPLTGIDVQTYAEDGKGVAKRLNNNLPKDLKERGAWLLRLVEAAVPWMEQWIGPHRDTVAHYRTLQSSGFVGVPNSSDSLVFSAPRDRSGAPLTDVADALFQDLFAFCQDFLVFSYRIRLHPLTDLVPCRGGRTTGGLLSRYVVGTRL